MAERAYLRGRLVGRLVGMQNSEKGYAFLSTGRGTPEYFIARNQVPPEHWFAGSILEFTPAPPKAGTANMRAETILPRNAPEEEKAS